MTILFAIAIGLSAAYLLVSGGKALANVTSGRKWWR